MNGQSGTPDGAKTLRIAGLGGSLRPTNLPDGFTDTLTSRYTDTKEKP